MTDATAISPIELVRTVLLFGLWSVGLSCLMILGLVLVGRDISPRPSVDNVPSIRSELIDIYFFGLFLIIQLGVPPLWPVLLFALPAYLAFRGVNTTELWGIKLFSPFAVCGIALFGFFCVIGILLPLNFGLQTLFHEIGYEPERQQAVQRILEADSLLRHAFVLTAIIFFAPMLEEMMFRGFLHPMLKASPLGSLGSIFVTAFFFALIHFYPAGFVQLLALGIAFGLVYEVTRSLPVAIMLHAAFNTFQIVNLTLLQASGQLSQL